MKENDVIITKEKIKNSGFYYFDINMKDIDSIKIVDTLPRFVLRTNGLDVGVVKKGFFKTEKGDVYRLSLHTNKRPYIKVFYSENQILFLNYRDSVRTLQLFNDIKKYVK